MVTYKAMVVLSNKRKDGTWTVVIRITHKGGSRRVSTPMVCKSADLTRSGRIKAPDVLDKADALIKEMRKALADVNPFELEEHDVDWVLSRIRSRLAGNAFSLDFFRWADSYIVCKGESTRKIYLSAINSLARYLGRREIDINDITRKMVLDFVDWVDAQSTIKGLTSGRYVTALGHIYRKAKDRHNDEDSGLIVIPRDPFGSVHVEPEGKAGKAQVCLPVETIQMIIDDTDCKARYALDVFLLSFTLMGANFADLRDAVPVDGDVWEYKRRKVAERTGATIEARIYPEMTPYIDRLRGKGEWWLNVLRMSDTENLMRMRVNYRLHRWCEAKGIEPFTMYAARHSWATLARRNGVDKSVVDDALGHKGDHPLVDIYAERAWPLAWQAQRVVLDLFRWEKR